MIGKKSILIRKNQKYAVPPYPEIHQRGFLSIENPDEFKSGICDLGIQIAKDGRVWICKNGIALIRFIPSEKIGPYGGDE